MQKFSWTHFKTVAALGLFSILVAACTATFNWREIRSDEQGFMALFPAKTKFEQKQLPFKDKLINASMEAAMADGALFAVSTLPVDEKDIPAAELLVLMQSNVKQTITQTSEPALLPIKFTIAGPNNQSIEGQGYQLAGLSPDHHYRVYWVYWLVRTVTGQPTRIFQLSAVKAFDKEPTAKELADLGEQFTTFMSGFKPY